MTNKTNPMYPRSERNQVIKVKSHNTSIRVLLACIFSYLKSGLRYKYLILDAYHPNIVITLSKEVRIRGYFSKPKRVREQKCLGNTDCIWCWLKTLYSQ